uniref:H15 domain-containing protein n=4 Tax=Triticinae TaxID=1648030 RepID=A0A453CLG5_AEGTS
RSFLKPQASRAHRTRSSFPFRHFLRLATMTALAKPAASAPKPSAAKPKAAAAGASHPTYFEMIKEAIAALKDRTGSSSVAIAKYIEEKHGKALPANFKKMLSVQLRASAAKGKLVKVKASYKLSDAAKKDAPKAKATAKPAKDAAKAKKTVAAKPKKTAAAGTKRKAPEQKKLVAKAKKSPAAKAKAKPKTVRSPAVKKARKVAAA